MFAQIRRWSSRAKMPAAARIANPLMLREEFVSERRSSSWSFVSVHMYRWQLHFEYRCGLETSERRRSTQRDKEKRVFKPRLSSKCSCRVYTCDEIHQHSVDCLHTMSLRSSSASAFLAQYSGTSSSCYSASRFTRAKIRHTARQRRLRPSQQILPIPPHNPTTRAAE